MFIWIFAIICLLEYDVDRNLKYQIEKIKTENYNQSVELIRLRTAIEEYQEKTERIIDTNFEILSEGGWK